MRPLRAPGEPPAKRRKPSLGGWLLRRAAQRTIKEALDGLEEISV